MRGCIAICRQLRCTAAGPTQLDCDEPDELELTLQLQLSGGLLAGV